MIQPNEVRVGNYLKGHLTGQPVKVDWLVIKHLLDGNIQSVYAFDVPAYEPIPLTGDVLEKQLGFVWSGGDHYERGDLWLEDYKGGYRVVRPHFCHTVFTTLHHFQNLYFALTGSELEVSLTGIGTDNK